MLYAYQSQCCQRTSKARIIHQIQLIRGITA
ncbi:Transposase [Shigella dysenteriae 1617]|uniref:Transposase n=1 Tax=Shigella dysenteriae 1617 TaxID=754093 RepID=A0A0A6ZTC2_SHIDY|nr:Transposase [Shigella dysenteriae 1617]